VHLLTLAVHLLEDRRERGGSGSYERVREAARVSLLFIAEDLFFVLSIP
jgi:hypothetical protein